MRNSNSSTFMFQGFWQSLSNFFKTSWNKLTSNMLIYLDISTTISIMYFFHDFSDMFLLLLLYYSLMNLLMHLVDMIVDYTKFYGHREKADFSFKIINDFSLFLGLVLLSGYISFQTTESFWRRTSILL